MDQRVAIYVILTLSILSVLLLALFLLSRTGERGVDAGKKALIWIVFLALLWSLRDVFAILFLTFIISFTANTIINYALSWRQLDRRLVVIATYLFLVGLIAGTVAFLLPHVRTEGRAFVDFASTLTPERVNAELDTFLASRPGIAEIVDSLRLREEMQESLLSQREDLVNAAGHGVRKILHLVTYFAISLIFSFLIMLDLPAMKTWIVTMKDTRLGAIYDETAETVVQFAGVLGQVFQAQIVIAFLNMILTTVGLLALGIPSITFLALVVFLCSFVPVLGVFVSSVPIGLLALREGGVEKLVAVVLWIIVIHVVEAYILNPRIMAMKMKLNPVLVLVILFISHHYFGLWGVLLGVPIAFYLFKYALPGRPFVLLAPTAKRRAARTSGGGPGTTGETTTSA